MRLYEFTNPSHYLPPETHAANPGKQNNDSKAADATDIADRHLKKKSPTKRPTNTL